MARKTSVMVSSSLRTIAIATMVSSIFWTVSGITNALKDPAETTVSPALLEPINPAIDMETLAAIQARRQLTDDASADELLQQAVAVAALARETDEVRPTAQPLPTAEPQTSPATVDEPVAEPDEETVLESPGEASL